MDERERFHRAVEAGEPTDDPAGGALGRALSALGELDAARADEALAEMSQAELSEPWRPMRAYAEILRATFSPSREGLQEGARAMEALLAELPAEDPTWPRAAHALASLHLRLADAEGAEASVAAALARLAPGAAHRRSWALDTAGTAFARSGAWIEARATYAAVVEAKRALGDAVGVAITAGSWGRMELDLGAGERALSIATEADGDALPPLTRVRLRTLALEAATEAGRDPAPHAAALEALLRGVDDAHHLAGYGALALARAEHARGLDPAPLLERAARSLQLPLGEALLSYWRRRMVPGPESDAEWLAEVSERFEALGVCTLPEVLALLYVAERLAPSDRATANRALDALAERVARSNNPLFFRWLDELGDGLDPRSASRRRLRRYLGPHAGSLDRTSRVEAAIVFSDLVGFTRRSAALAPEEVMDTVRSVFELASPLLLAERLEPLQYLGDGLLALALGEGHGERALSFARAVVRRMARVTAIRAAYRADDPELYRMNVRCGVAAGPVVLGPIGSLVRTEHLAIGLTTNRAARLQGYAEPDEVVCDAALGEGGEVFEVTPKGLASIRARRLAG